MKNSKALPLALILMSIAYSSMSEAALLMFSRANCYVVPYANIGSESISWDPALTQRRLRTYSTHYVRGVFRHQLNTGWQTTSWSHANHREIPSQALWYVVGHHYQFWNNRIYLLRQTQATNCNLLF